MIRYIISIISLLSVCISTLDAQSLDLGRECDALRSALNGLNADIEALKAQDAALADSIAAFKLQSSKKASADTIAALSAGIDALNQKIEAAKQTVSDNSSAINADVASMLEAERQAGADIKNIQAYMPTYGHVRAKEMLAYTERLYSEMDTVTINAYIDEANRYADIPAMQQCIVPLEQTLMLKTMVDEDFIMLKESYGPNIYQARVKLFENRDKFTKKQLDELSNTLDAPLSWYHDGLVDMDGLFKKIEKISNDLKLSPEAKAANVRNIFVKDQKSYNYLKYIPYLGTRYDDIRAMFEQMSPEQVIADQRYQTIKDEIKKALAQ